MVDSWKFQFPIKTNCEAVSSENISQFHQQRKQWQLIPGKVVSTTFFRNQVDMNIRLKRNIENKGGKLLKSSSVQMHQFLCLYSNFDPDQKIKNIHKRSNEIYIKKREKLKQISEVKEQQHQRQTQKTNCKANPIQYTHGLILLILKEKNSLFKFSQTNGVIS